MQTLSSIRTLVHRIDLSGPMQGWAFESTKLDQHFYSGGPGDTGGRLGLRVVCPDGKCNVTQEALPWNGRWWFLSEHMTDGEVVQTAFKAVLTALEHEARENFKLDGVEILNPHWDLDRLLEFAKDPKSIKERDPA